MTFTFVVATSKQKGTRLPIHEFLDKVKFPDWTWVELDIAYANKSGLSELYNKAIEKHSDSDYWIFCHDDLQINDFDFYQKVKESKFDVMGPVGGCYWGIPPGFDVEHKPLIWTTATCGKGASGFMNHDLTSSGHPGIYLPSSYGPAPLPTTSLDGCCLILNKHAVEKGLRFDSSMTFHWYDIALCAEARKLGLNIGTVPVLCTHGSVGASVVQPEFMKAQNRFIRRFFTTNLG